HAPIPVSSGVRFAAKETPHGPAAAVNPGLNIIHCALAGTSGRASSAGWPDINRVVSGIGPNSVKTFGEWQSLHPATVVRYFPRLTSSSCDNSGVVPEMNGCVLHDMNDTNKVTAVSDAIRVVFIMGS